MNIKIIKMSVIKQQKNFMYSTAFWKWSDIMRYKKFSALLYSYIVKETKYTFDISGV